MEQKESETKPKTAQKMGWIQGVLVNILRALVNYMSGFFGQSVSVL